MLWAPCGWLGWLYGQATTSAATRRLQLEAELSQIQAQESVVSALIARKREEARLATLPPPPCVSPPAGAGGSSCGGGPAPGDGAAEATPRPPTRTQRQLLEAELADVVAQERLVHVLLAARQQQQQQQGEAGRGHARSTQLPLASLT